MQRRTKVRRIARYCSKHMLTAIAHEISGARFAIAPNEQGGNSGALRFRLTV